MLVLCCALLLFSTLMGRTVLWLDSEIQYCLFETMFKCDMRVYVTSNFLLWIYLSFLLWWTVLDQSNFRDGTISEFNALSMSHQPNLWKGKVEKTQHLCYMIIFKMQISFELLKDNKTLWIGSFITWPITCYIMQFVHYLSVLLLCIKRCWGKCMQSFHRWLLLVSVSTGPCKVSILVLVALLKVKNYRHHLLKSRQVFYISMSAMHTAVRVWDDKNGRSTRTKHSTSITTNTPCASTHTPCASAHNVSHTLSQCI